MDRCVFVDYVSGADQNSGTFGEMKLFENEII